VNVTQINETAERLSSNNKDSWKRDIFVTDERMTVDEYLLHIISSTNNKL
jgi:hypothetical protein